MQVPNRSSSSCFSPLSGRYSTFSRQAPGAEMKSKGKQKEATNPDLDANYVDDNEDFGCVEEEDENLDFAADSEDTEPV